MRFALMIEPQQGVTYEDQLAIARCAEAAGFEAFFRSDHYAGFPGEGEGPTTDAWAVLAGLARETERITLGTLVSPVTFRHPGNFVKLVTTVDHMSGGRLEVGVGAGWNEQDHCPARAPVPIARGTSRPARRRARHPPRPLDRAGRLVVRGPPRDGLGGPASAAARGRAGPSA